MGEVIITPGKGGVVKLRLQQMWSSCLNNKRVVLVDADIGLRNLTLYWTRKQDCI